MKTVSRLFTLLLTLSLVFSLAACSKTPAATDNPASTSTPADKPTDAPEADPGTATLPLANETKTYSMWIPNFIGSDMPYTDPNELPIWQELEQRTNIHFEWELASSTDKSAQFSLMLTSGEYTDLFGYAVDLLNGGVDYSIDEELIVDLADLVPQYAPNYYELMGRDDYSRKCFYTDTGKLGVLRLQEKHIARTWMGWAIRQDQLTSIGYNGVPVTFDDWTEVLAAFQANGYGQLYLGSATCQQAMLMAGYGVANEFMQKDGKIFYGPTDEGYYKYLELIASWNEAGYLQPDFLSSKGVFTDYPMMVSGEVSIMPIMTSFYDRISTEGVAENPDFEIVPFDSPREHAEDPLHVRYTSVSENLMGGGTVCISTACEDIPTILRWFDYLCTDEGYLLANYGIEGKSYSLVDGSPMYTDIILQNPEGLTVNQAKTLYTVPMQLAWYHDTDSEIQTMSANALHCTEIWAAAFDNEQKWTLPADNTMTFTMEETENLGSIQGDISTYVEEYTALVVTGQQDLDSTWEEYISNIEDMGLQECIDIYQAAYDRFISR